MAKRFTEVDVHPWKVASHNGVTLKDAKGKPLNNFKGYVDAAKAAKEYGGVAMRA